MADKLETSHTGIASLSIGGIKSQISLSHYDSLKEKIQSTRVLILDGGFLEACAIHESKSKKDIVDSLGGGTTVVVMPPGEGVKNRANFSLLLETLFALNLTRKDLIAVIGGGALCDMVSYVASVYMRGIGLILIPSTLLSMIDASIGGKTAINFGVLKNMVGSFYPADEVVVVPSIISTLSPTLIKEGFAELLKAGLLRNEDIVNTIEDHPELWNARYEDNKAIWEALIIQAIRVKTEVVQEDFKEDNVRAHLNLGHTFAHAHEATARTKGMRVSHGEAVGMGMRAAMQLGLSLNFTQKEYANRVISLLNKIGYAHTYEGLEANSLLSYMKKDKKRENDTIRVIVQKKLNDTHILSVDEDIIRESLMQLGAR